MYLGFETVYLGFATVYLGFETVYLVFMHLKPLGASVIKPSALAAQPGTATPPPPPLSKSSCRQVQIIREAPL